jgi:hypothetical protein
VISLALAQTLFCRRPEFALAEFAPARDIRGREGAAPGADLVNPLRMPGAVSFDGAASKVACQRPGDRDGLLISPGRGLGRDFFCEQVPGGGDLLSWRSVARLLTIVSLVYVDTH